MGRGIWGDAPIFYFMKHFQIQYPISRAQLAILYQIRIETLRVWLRNAEVRRSYLLKRDDLDLLFDLYGKPCLTTYPKKPSILQEVSRVDLTEQKLQNEKLILCFPVRRKQLGKIFQVDTRTIRRWLEDIGINHAETLSPKELKVFFQRYGIPNEYRLGF